MNLNHFVITGNVTRDLELRYTANGTPTVTFAVACNDVWYDDAGTKHEECDFIPVTTFGKQAERDAKFLAKGSPVAVEGRIQSWYQPAEKRGGFNFKASRVQYLGKLAAPQTSGAAEGTRGGGQGGAEDRERDEWAREFEAANAEIAKPLRTR